MSPRQDRGDIFLVQVEAVFQQDREIVGVVDDDIVFAGAMDKEDRV
jgi:hypothetical protein